jgi:hypothetical protein
LNASIADVNMILIVRMTKMETGWKPKNPYAGEIDLFNNIRLATKQGFDEGVKEGQKKLLEYMIREWTPLSFPSGLIEQCKTMLRELKRRK